MFCFSFHWAKLMCLFSVNWLMICCYGEDFASVCCGYGKHVQWCLHATYSLIRLPAFHTTDILMFPVSGFSTKRKIKFFQFAAQILHSFEMKNSLERINWPDELYINALYLENWFPLFQYFAKINHCSSRYTYLSMETFSNVNLIMQNWILYEIIRCDCDTLLL